MCITVVVTVTKAHVKADDNPQAPDNLIYFVYRIDVFIQMHRDSGSE